MNTWLPLLAGFLGTIIGGVIAYAKSISQPPREKAERQKLSTEATTVHKSADAAYTAFLHEAARIAKGLV